MGGDSAAPSRWELNFEAMLRNQHSIWYHHFCSLTFRRSVPPLHEVMCRSVKWAPLVTYCVNVLSYSSRGPIGKQRGDTGHFSSPQPMAGNNCPRESRYIEHGHCKPAFAFGVMNHTTNLLVAAACPRIIICDLWIIFVSIMDIKKQFTELGLFI